MTVISKTIGLYKRVDKMNNISKYLKRCPNTLKKHFMVYSLILLLPVLILGSLFYIRLSSTIRSDIENYYYNKANAAVKYFEQQLRELDMISVNISFNSSIYPYNKKELQHYTEKEIDTLISQLSNAAIHLDIIDDVFLYLYGEDIMPSSRGMVTLDTFTQSMLNVDQEDREYILDIIKNRNDIGIYKYKVDSSYLYFNRQYQSNSDYKALYIYPITLYPVAMSEGKTYGNIIFIMNIDNISLKINNIMGDDQSCFYVINKDNELLFDLGKRNLINFDLQKENIISSEVYNKMISIKKDSSFFSFVNLALPSQKFKYTYVFSQKSSMGSINTLQRKIVEWVFYGSLLSLIFSFIISIISFRPIKSIASIIQKNIDSGKSKTKDGIVLPNDFESIKLELIRMFNEKDHLTETVYSQMPYVRDQIILGLLKGKSFDNKDYPAFRK